MKRFMILAVALFFIYATTLAAYAGPSQDLSNSLANTLKANQVDCDGDSTKDLWADTWRSGPNPTGWDEYSLVIGANAMAGLKLHGDTTEADNAGNYFFVTNKNWARKANEEPIVGTGGSAFYADSSYTGEDSWGVAWGFHGQDYSNTGRNSSPEGMDNMLIGTYNLAIAGYYDEAALLGNAIIGQTNPNKPWSNNRQYWDDTNHHIVYPDSSWREQDELMSTAEFMRALQIITDNSTYDYSTVIGQMNAWHGGYGNSWDEAIDQYFEPEEYQYDDHYDDIYKLLADYDASAAQNLADNIDLDNPYFSYAIANIWAIHAMAENGQEDVASQMTLGLVGKYYCWSINDVAATYPNRCRGALLMANEIAPVPEPSTIMLIAGSGLFALMGILRRKLRK